jgi:hypothetical protein
MKVYVVLVRPSYRSTYSWWIMSAWWKVAARVTCASAKRICVMRQCPPSTTYHCYFTHHSSSCSSYPASILTCWLLHMVAWCTDRFRSSIDLHLWWSISTTITLDNINTTLPKCVCVCVYVCIYIYIHTHTHTHTHSQQ